MTSEGCDFVVVSASISAINKRKKKHTGKSIQWVKPFAEYELCLFKKKKNWKDFLVRRYIRNFFDLFFGSFFMISRTPVTTGTVLVFKGQIFFFSTTTIFCFPLSPIFYPRTVVRDDIQFLHSVCTASDAKCY